MTRTLVLVLFGWLATVPLSAQLKLVIGDLSIASEHLNEPTCVQIPIFIQDPDMQGRYLAVVNYVLELTGDVGIIDGGVATDMLVVRGFYTSNDTGVTNPPTDLENLSPVNDPSPLCGNIINQAILGGSEHIFATGTNNLLNWILNNNYESMGFKLALALDIFNVEALAQLTQDELYLVGVLEIPLIANPGDAQITISVVDPMVSTDPAWYNWGVNTTDPWLLDDFDTSEAVGTVRICAQELLTWPDDQTVCAGDMVSMTVSTSGNGPKTYQWFRDNQPLAGATESSLSFTTSSAADGGSYTCVIDNGCGQLATPPAVITFDPLTVSLSTAWTALGLTPPTTSATADCGPLPYSYRWEDSNGMLVASSATLVLDPPPNESEIYTLTVEDDLLQNTSANFIVLVNPLGPDLNGDGQNNPEDLWLVLPDWMEDVFDVDGDGVLTVLDMLYINVGQD